MVDGLLLMFDTSDGKTLVFFTGRVDGDTPAVLKWHEKRTKTRCA